VSGASPLEQRLQLEQVGDDVWEASTWVETGPVYGGLLVAQALQAAHRTVARPRWPHSLHASFLAAPRAGVPLRHTVERSRDGGSFATRRVVVTQDERPDPVFLLTVSFHAPEAGVDYERTFPRGVPGPEGLRTGRYDSEVFECRDVPVRESQPGAPEHTRHMWFRLKGELGADAAMHVYGLAYASDHGPTRSVRQPHAGHPGLEGRMSVSLDHSVWFHRPVRVDQWLLSELVPQSTAAARGLTVGQIWTADGKHVATVAQEILLRMPPQG
jgi:acyl-CoA thioesterase-2